MANLFIDIKQHIKSSLDTGLVSATRRFAMVIRDLITVLDAKVWTAERNMDVKILGACGSDLMSDVLAFGENKTILITGLNNAHVVRTAEMLDISCIIFSRGKEPSKEVLEMAEECSIAIMSTKHTLYVTCGIIYSQGIPGGSEATAKERC